MSLAGENVAAGVNGIAALAIIKMLLDILQKKQIISEEEIEIILNCAEAEVDSDDKTDIGGRVIEAKLLISNLMNESDDTTRGYDGRTRS
jgi:hypothetical protein